MALALWLIELAEKQIRKLPWESTESTIFLKKKKFSSTHCTSVVHSHQQMPQDCFIYFSKQQIEFCVLLNGNFRL